jgi:BASS family bile acid:Na+ symporter
LGQLVAPLRNYRLMIRGLLAGLVAPALVAFTLINLIPMDQATQIAFILVVLAAGAEGGPKFVQMAGGNSAFALGLMAVMLTVTVVGMPLAISLMVPDAQIERGAVLLKLLMAVALPLGFGLLIRARRQALADRLSPSLHRISMILLVLVLAQLLYANFGTVLAIEPSTLAAALLLFATTGAIGYGMGGPERADRRAMSIMTFARAASISMMIASQAFAHEPKVMAVVVVLGIMTFVTAACLAAWFRRMPA